MSDTTSAHASHEATAHGGHQLGIHIPSYTATGMMQHVIQVYRETPAALAMPILVSGAIFALGIIGIAAKFAQGVPSQGFGYYAATIAFLMTTFLGAPLPVIAARFTKGDWRRGFARLSELFAVTTVIPLVFIIPLFFVLPANKPGQSTMWFGWWWAPHFWDWLGVLSLAIVGFGLVAASVRPDWAALRVEGFTGGHLNSAKVWLGSMKQWRVLRASTTPLGAFYLSAFVVMGLLYSTDFTMSLVPGWRDAIFPAYFSIQGFQGGIATLIIAMAFMRRTSLREYVQTEQFWGLSKLMLAMSLQWVYHWLSSFMIFWYGRLPREIQLLKLMFYGEYTWALIVSILCCFIIPLGALMWNPVRKSIRGPVIIAGIVLFGNFVNQIRLFVSTWALTDNVGEKHILPDASIPAFMFPRWEDYLIMPGLIAGCIFVYLIALRFIPAISMWEVAEGTLFRKRLPYLSGHVTVVGKPE